MPISSEKYQSILEKTGRAASSFDLDGFRTALRDRGLAGVLTETTTPEAVAALQALVDSANTHGLEASDFGHALSEIQEQLNIEGSAVARHEFEADKKATSFLNIPRQIGLRWQGMLETLGRGKIAERAKQQREGRLQDRDYIASVAQAAIERASLRKRYHEYIRLADNVNFSEVLTDYRKGIISRSEVLTDLSFLNGVENILSKLNVPDPFVLDGVDIPLTPDNLDLIKNHLRLLLRDEVLQLTQLSQMNVMETKAYQVDHKSAGTIAAKILGSGTLWGMTIRGGSKIAIGGSIAAASFAATPVGMGVMGLAVVGAGAAAGYLSQTAEYKFARRAQRKMDLAIGATTATVENADGDAIEVAKNAEQISAGLKVKVERLNQLKVEVKTDDTKYAELKTAIEDTYRIMMDAEWRLAYSSQGKDKQDYISFGLNNRLQAALEFTRNLKEVSRAIQEAKTVYADRIGLGFRDTVIEDALVDIARATQTDIKTVRQYLESALMQGEQKRRLFGALVGGTFAGLSAVAMDYIHEWFSDTGVTPAQTPTFEQQPELVVQQGSEQFIVKPSATGDLLLSNSAGTEQVIDLPPGVDAQHVVVTPDLEIYNAATGDPIGHINVDISSAVGETLKTPQLEGNLSIDHNQIVQAQGKAFGLALDKDGNLALYNVKPDGSIDVAQPVVPPTNVVSPELHARIDALDGDAAEQVMRSITQLHVETQPDGTIVMKSVYDSSTIAEFKVDASGAVTMPEPPAPVTSATSGELLDRLYADANSDVAKLLNKMGVQSGEISKDANGNYYITDEVVKGEYLGNTEGWRQVRMELLLKATQEGKIGNGESADMVVARLERATRHLLLESNKYPDANAALNEAFGKDANFIKGSELPWINGPKSVVSNDWEKLVDAMRNLPDQTTTTAPTPGAAVAPGVSGPAPEPSLGIHPINPDTVYSPGQPAGLHGEFAGDQANSLAREAAYYSLNTALGVAGMALEGLAQPSQLIGADQTIAPAMGTKLEAFNFVKAPEVPKPVDPEQEAKTLFERLEQDYEGPLRTLEQQLMALRLEWNKSSHPVVTADELDTLSLAGSIARLTNLELMMTDASLLDQFITGKTPNTLRGYFERAVAAGAAGTNEIQQAANDRARWAVQEGVKDLSTLDYQLANTDQAEVSGYLDMLRNNLPYLLQIDDNLQQLFMPTIPSTELPAVSNLIRDSRGAISKLETHLAALAAASVPTPDQVPAPTPSNDLGEPAAEPVEDSAEAEARRAAFLEGSRDQDLRMEVEDRYSKVNDILADRLKYQYIDRGHANVLAAIADEMEKQGVFDSAHVAPLFHYLGKLQGNGSDRLWRSNMMHADGKPDEFVIKKIVEQLRSKPAESPFADAASGPTPAAPEATPAATEASAEKKRDLTAAFKSPEFTAAFVGALTTAGRTAAQQDTAITKLLANWTRLKRAEDFLDKLTTADQLLAAISIDLNDASTVTALVERIKAGAANLIELADTPERLEWKVDNKLEKIKNTFGFQTRFVARLRSALQDASLSLNQRVAALSWFNDQWNSLRVANSQLVAEPTQKLLKRFGVIDAADQWSDAQADVVMRNIINQDKAWLQQVAERDMNAAPASAADALNNRDDDF